MRIERYHSPRPAAEIVRHLRVTRLQRSALWVFLVPQVKGAVNKRIDHRIRHAEEEDYRLQAPVFLVAGDNKDQAEFHEVIRRPADEKSQHDGDGHPERFEFGAT